MTSKRYWKIEGYRSTTVFWSRSLPTGTFSERRIEALLKCLVAKYGLDDDETVSAFANHNAKQYVPHLRVSRPGGNLPWSLSCGTNPYFIARVEVEDAV